MAFSYDRYERRSGRGNGPVQRSALGYWIPLTLTVTAAAIGLAAWAWNERKDYDEDDDKSEVRRHSERRKYEQRHSESINAAVPGESGQPAGAFPGESSYQHQTVIDTEQREYSSGQRGFADLSAETANQHDGENETLIGRMSGVIRRTPSPQQLFDGASKRVVASVTAAGAIMGGALGAIREDPEKDDFVDHERWSEEADTQEKELTDVQPIVSNTGNVVGVGSRVPPAVASARSAGGRDFGPNNGKRRMVAVVLSSEADNEESHDTEAMWRSEHASILSHLPTINSETIQLLILIYAPHLNFSSQPQTFSKGDSPSVTPTVHTPATTPGAELTSMDPEPFSSKLTEPISYTTLYNEAVTLVGSNNSTSVIPFATPTGHVHLLRHLGPSVVYLQESLSNTPGNLNGEVVNQISGWVGQVVVVVGGDLGGGLVDTETEDEGADGGAAGRRANTISLNSPKWWQEESRVGLGKGVEVVEGLRMSEDWGKRVGGV